MNILRRCQNEYRLEYLKVYDEGDRTSPTGWHTHNVAIRAIMTRTQIWQKSVKFY